MKKFLVGVLAAGLCLAQNCWAKAGAAGVELALREMAKERGLRPVRRTDDATFLRRAYLTLAGKLPYPSEVRDFLRDNSPRKRAEIVDMLLDSPDFATLMAMRCCQIYRVKSEFPINMWPNAVQLFHRYLYDAARKDRPYDVVVREMLTSSGSNFRVPQVNFLRGHADRTAKGVARGVALGTSSHAIGTAKAMELGETEGAMSSLSIVICGIFTVLGSMFFAQLH